MSERDSGGELTVDHYQPQMANGGDDLENLVYACYRCNLYKGDYWTTENVPRIFNPRLESINEHFWLSANGMLYALTATAAFTIHRLKLNRAPLQARRQRLLEQAAEREFFEQMQKSVNLLAQTNEQQRQQIEEQRKLLEEQQRLLKILLISDNE